MEVFWWNMNTYLRVMSYIDFETEIIEIHLQEDSGMPNLLYTR